MRRGRTTGVATPPAHRGALAVVLVGTLLLALAACAREEPELTFEDYCAMQTGPLELTAVVVGGDVVLRWLDDTGHIGPTTYRVAHRAPGEAGWTLLATLRLREDAERRYVHGAGAWAARWKYTVAADTGCLDGADDVCAPDRPCPVATRAAGPDER